LTNISTSNKYILLCSFIISSTILVTTFLNPVFAQALDTSNYGLKITYPSNGQQVQVGELTMFGTATYNATITDDCTVYADWNDLQPMQMAMPAGPNYTEFGRTDDDYSTWIFSYTDKYHEIIEGPNELTAKLSCDIGPFNSTKYYSVNVTGVP
jgi:hypothetical protein